MKIVTLTYGDSGWRMNADPPVTVEDPIVVFRNHSDRRCQVTFKESAAFGILGIALAPHGAFHLVYRGVQTLCKVDDAVDPEERDGDGVNPTIPPGSGTSESS